MKSNRVTATTTKKEHITLDSQPIFGRENTLWMWIGAAVMVAGFLLMAGGRSEDPNVFNKDAVYSTVRITIAPIVLLAGLVCLVFSIFRKPKRS